jgi:hypothetical protein
MKRLVSFLLLVVFLGVGLCGCSGSGPKVEMSTHKQDVIKDVPKKNSESAQ